MWRIVKRWLSSSKFVLTTGSLIGTFALAALGRDVRQLEILVPSILFFYIGGNVAQDASRRKLGEYKDGTDSRDNS